MYKSKFLARLHVILAKQYDHEYISQISQMIIDRSFKFDNDFHWIWEINMEGVPKVNFLHNLLSWLDSLGTWGEWVSV